MSKHLAARGQCHDRGIAAADTAAADRDQKIAASSPNARATEAASRAAASMLTYLGAGGARGLGDQLRRQRRRRGY